MPKKSITLEDIEKMDKSVLVAADVAPLLACDPHSIRVQARTNPSKLGFPVNVQGSRVRIPKEGFVRFMRLGLEANS